MKRFLVPVCLVLLLAMPAAHANICRVTTAGVANNDGSAWGSATTLQDALANGNGKDCTEIWIAKGVYVPGAADTDTFAINRPLKLYGGFAGRETRSKNGVRDHFSVPSADERIRNRP